jgi:hypothetical protein
MKGSAPYRQLLSRRSCHRQGASCMGLLGNWETSVAAVGVYVLTMHLLLTYVLISLEAPKKQTHTCMSTTNAL